MNNRALDILPALFVHIKYLSAKNQAIALFLTENRIKNTEKQLVLMSPQELCDFEDALLEEIDYKLDPLNN